MRRSVGWLALALGLGFTLSTGRADDPPKKDADKKPLAEVAKELSKKSMDAQREYIKVIQANQPKKDDSADEQKKKSKINQEAALAYQKAMNDTGAEALKLAKKHAKDPEVMPLIELAMDMAARSGGDNRKEVLAILTEHHLQHPKLGSVIANFMYDSSPEGKEFLEKVLEKSTDKQAKGLALFAMGKQLKEKIAGYSAEPTDEEIAEISPQAEKYFNMVVAEYSDVKAPYGTGTLGEMAKGELAGLKNLPLLRIGKVAPDIEGEDIDGKPFKLSDYRGKVVLLDFWGHW